MGEVIVVLCLIMYGLSYEVLYSFNCGAEHQVKTPLLNFNSVQPSSMQDEMFEGLKSRGAKK